MSYCDFSVLAGQTLTAIEVTRGDEDQILFVTTEGNRYCMRHDQDCCESVTIEDICGDTESLIGHVLVMAEERGHSGGSNDVDSYTWTFYILATDRGSVTSRWYGTSNGYYSEAVSLYEV